MKKGEIINKVQILSVENLISKLDKNITDLEVKIVQSTVGSRICNSISVVSMRQNEQSVLSCEGYCLNVLTSAKILRMDNLIAAKMSAEFIRYKLIELLPKINISKIVVIEGE